jgi:microcompartment protein CcmL/EutN
MAPIDSIGLLEVSSVATGYRAGDAMLKAAPVGLIMSRSICSGKFLIAVSGDVSSVKLATAAGGTAAGASVIEQGVISQLHPSVFPAIGQAVQLESRDIGALGVIETFSAGSIIMAADAAAKAADVILFRLHLAMALGGKGFLLMTGDLGNVQAALEAGKDAASGMLVNAVIIPSPDRILLRDYI